MARSQTRRTTTRQPLDPSRSTPALRPQQRITPGSAGDGMGRLVEALEAVRPGLKSLADNYDRRKAEEQRSLAEADAMSEFVAGTMPDEVEQEAERFENPTYREAWRSKRYELMVNDEVSEIQAELAANANNPEFDANAFWQQRTQDLLSEVPDDVKGLVADQVGVAHGQWKKNDLRRRVENQADESMQAYRASVESHVQTLDGSNARPNQETLNAYIEDAQELNISESEARKNYLTRVGQYAINQGKPELLESLDFLRNDPVLAEEYDRLRDSATAKAEERLSVSETTIRDEHRQLVERGEFTTATVEEIANDPAASDLYGEEQLASMLSQSRQARQSANEQASTVNRFLNDPNAWAQANGETMTSDARSQVFQQGLERLQANYPDDPETAYRLWIQKMAEAGDYGVSENLRSQLVAQGTVTDLNSVDGEVPAPFKRGFDTYQLMKEGIAGGSDVAERHLEGTAAKENFAIYASFKEAGMTDPEAYQALQRSRKDAVSLDEFQSYEASDEIDDAVDDLDVKEFPGTARQWVKDKAYRYGRLGIDPEQSIKLAKDAWENTHTTVFGSPVYHGGYTSEVENAEEVVSWHFEQNRETMADAIGMDPEELDFSEVSIRQHWEYPDMMVPYLNGMPLADQTFSLGRVRREYTDAQREQARIEANQSREERVGPRADYMNPSAARAIRGSSGE